MRCAVFTVFNPSESLVQRLLTSDVFCYILFGKEKTSSGTPHLQGYCEFDNAKSRTRIRSLLGGTAHVEPRRGSQLQACIYCKKDGDWYEAGTPSQQGRRSDLFAMQALIRKGASDLMLYEQYPSQMCMYRRAMAHYRSLCASPRDRQKVPDVRFYVGATGKGKTRAAWDEFDDLCVHPGGLWFDGYSPGKSILFDDLDDTCFSLSYLLLLLDRYPMLVPVKGGFVQFSPPTIIITSNTPCSEWYPDESADRRSALLRRLSVTRVFL